METAKTPLSTAFILHCRRSDIFFINRHALSKPRKSYNNSTNSAKEFITAIFKKEYTCIIFLNDARHEQIFLKSRAATELGGGAACWPTFPLNSCPHASYEYVPHVPKRKIHIQGGDKALLVSYEFMLHSLIKSFRVAGGYVTSAWKYA